MLTLKIVSPEKVVYDGPVENVFVPGVQGNFEILDNHAPIVSLLEEGNVEYTTTEGRQSLRVKAGFVSVKKNQVNVCVEV